MTNLIYDPDLIEDFYKVVYTMPANLTNSIVIKGRISLKPNLEDSQTPFVTLQALYSYLKESWCSYVSLTRYPFPIRAITPIEFEILRHWAIDDSYLCNATYTDEDSNYTYKLPIITQDMNLPTKQLNLDPFKRTVSLRYCLHRRDKL